MNITAESVLDDLLGQEWFADLGYVTISRTDDGEIIVWAETEIYRIGPGGSIVRITTRGTERVIL